jgi:hypothetical protein
MKWNNKIDPATIPDDVLYAEVGRRRGAKRETFGGGRPRSAERCACGLMTLKRAQARGRSPEHGEACPFHRPAK